MGRTPSYLGLLGFDALTFLTAAAIYRRLPEQGKALSRSSRVRDVLRNRPFVLATVSEATLALHETLLRIALPLWIALRTDLPHAIVGIMVATSAVTCVLTQVPAARGTATIAGAGRAARRSSYLLAAACLIYSLAHGDHAPMLLIGLLLAATLIRAAGEVTQTASAWGLSFALAPVQQAGIYQSFFSTGYSATIVAAPLLWTAIATRHDSLGWFLVAGLFIGAGHLAAGAARWADADRSSRQGSTLAIAGGDS